MLAGRDGVLEAAMVGKRHREAGDACLLQQRHEDRQLLKQHARLPIAGVLLANGELVVDGHLGHRLAHGAHGLHGKAGAALWGAAVLVLATAHEGAGEAAHHAITVNLHDVEAKLAGTHRRRAKGRRDGAHLADGHVRDELLCLLVEDVTELHHRNLLHKDARHVGNERLKVRV